MVRRCRRAGFSRRLDPGKRDGLRLIIRYPQDRQAVTGYTYEPWHLRYVGHETASAFQDSGAATLEDYLGMPPAPRY